MPEVVKPGEKIYVVVDDVAYLVVNDDGSDIGRSSTPTSTQQSANGQLVSDDREVFSSNSVTLANGHCESMSDDSGVSKSSAKQLVPQDESERISSHHSETKTAASSNELLNFSQSSDVPSKTAVSEPRTVLAENDSEFEHLADMSESTDSGLSDTRTSTSKAASYVNSFIGFIRGKSPPTASIGRLPLPRPQMPKFVVQARPRLRLPTPISAAVGSEVRPTTVAGTSTVSPPARPMVTTVIRNIGTSSDKVAEQKQSTSIEKSPVKESSSDEKVRPTTVRETSTVSPLARHTVTTIIRSTGNSSDKVTEQKQFASVQKSPVKGSSSVEKVTVGQAVRRVNVLEPGAISPVMPNAVTAVVRRKLSEKVPKRKRSLSADKSPAKEKSSVAKKITAVKKSVKPSRQPRLSKRM